MRTKSFVKMPAMILEDVRAIEAGDDAMHLWWSMWCRSLVMNTDGRWRGVQVSRLSVPDWESRLRALIDNTLVADVDGGFDTFELIDWLDYNESVNERANRLKKDAERKKEARARREVRAAGVSEKTS